MGYGGGWGVQKIRKWLRFRVMTSLNSVIAQDVTLVLPRCEIGQWSVLSVFIMPSFHPSVSRLSRCASVSVSVSDRASETAREVTHNFITQGLRL